MIWERAWLIPGSFDLIGKGDKSLVPFIPNQLNPARHRDGEVPPSQRGQYNAWGEVNGMSVDDFVPTFSIDEN
jgi:hypothetical protein